ncbi:galactose oxidase early set domain-containing protein, partial [Variovorax sp. MHTC-1]|uniref:galactose oxidase early set domain-containing protein n=1 Tax=Variovorax sp. MHTC-1 TaxID=2495593 RepID=UPI000F89970B
LNAEIYSPPYLFDSNGQRRARPIINQTPAQLTLGTDFRVTVASSRPIRRVTLIRTGAVTHSTDFGQRFLELPFTQATGSSNVDITLNESPNVVPIGHYLLYVIDDNGVPSVGKILKVDGSVTKVADQGQTF